MEDVRPTAEECWDRAWEIIFRWYRHHGPAAGTRPADAEVAAEQEQAGQPAGDVTGEQPAP